MPLLCYDSDAMHFDEQGMLTAYHHALWFRAHTRQGPGQGRGGVAHTTRMTTTTGGMRMQRNKGHCVMCVKHGYNMSGPARGPARHGNGPVSSVVGAVCPRTHSVAEGQNSTTIQGETQAYDNTLAGSQQAIIRHGTQAAQSKGLRL